MDSRTCLAAAIVVLGVWPLLAAASADDPVVAQFQRLYDASKGDSRAEAGEVLIEALVASAEARAVFGASAEAKVLAARALAVATAIGSDRKNDVEARVENFAARQRAETLLAALKARLETNPREAACRKAAVRLLVVELDDPVQAAALVDESCDEAVRKYVPAAAKGVEAAPELAAVEIGRWYLGLADATAGPAKAAMLTRARAYTKRYLELHTPEDIARTQATIILGRIEEQLAKLVPKKEIGPGPWIDLLKRVDPAKDRAGGRWELKDGALSCGHMSRLGFPCAPEGSYQLVVVFTRTDGASDIDFLLPVGATAGAFCISKYSGSYSELETVRTGVGRTPSGKLVNGAQYMLDVTVRVKRDQADVNVSLNGKPFFHWQGAIAALAIAEDAHRLPDPKCLGLSTHAAAVAFKSVRLRMLSGCARMLR